MRSPSGFQGVSDLGYRFVAHAPYVARPWMAARPVRLYDSGVSNARPVTVGICLLRLSARSTFSS